MTLHDDTVGQPIYFIESETVKRGTENQRSGVITEIANTVPSEVISQLEEIRKVLSAEVHPRYKTIYEERHADELQLNEIFESLLEILEKADPQNIIHVYFLHPSTRSESFSGRLKEIVSYSGANERAQAVLGEDRCVRAGNHTKAHSLVVENYFNS